MFKKEITVVIPTKSQERPPTLDSLCGYKTVVQFDEGKGANWARNQGFKKVETPFVLFSDDDIVWEADALEALYQDILASNASYSYGSYELDGKIYCDKEFDAELLKKTNYISTMSLIRSQDFPGFDESIERLQDWDLWLTMLSQGKYGHYCGKKIFKTSERKGISTGIPYNVAHEIILKKHHDTICALHPNPI